MSEIGTEIVESSEEERLRKTDPRDYIRASAFQKEARSIDSNPDHPWEIFPEDYDWTKDSGGEVAVAKVYDPESKKRSYLVVEKSGEDTGSSSYLKDIPSAIGDYVSDLLKEVSRRFPPVQRQNFFKKIVGMSEQLGKIPTEKLEESLVSEAIDLLDDDPKALKLETPITEFPRTNYGPAELNDEQRLQLQRYLALVSRKMPADKFQLELKRFMADIPFSDEVYGRNYHYIFGDIFRWILNSRPDTQVDETRQSVRDLVVRFPVEKLIKKGIPSLEEAEAILNSEQVKPEPDTRIMSTLGTDVEFVELNKVMGAPFLKNWAKIERSDAEGRSTYKFIKGLAEGTIEVTAKTEPISVNEINGEYFVGSDGTHRVAALKALGVPFVPMVVTHYQHAI